LTSSVDRTLAEVNLRRAYRPTTHIRVRYVVATRTDFLVRGVVVRSRRAFRGLKTLSEVIKRNVHAHSFRFFWTKIFVC